MSEAKHLVWLDVTRWFAMFFVVVSHAGDTFNFNAPPGDAAYAFWGEVWGSLARFCVPVFAMMTGFLLLPVKQDGGAFAKKRIGRVLPPFLFWSALYCLLPWLVALCGGTNDTLRIFIPFADCGVGWAPTWAALRQIPLNFCALTTHMWYVYMLIGLYLVLPVFSPWYEKANAKAKWAFLGLWGVSLVLPYVRNYLGDGHVWGECAWNDYGLLYGFSGFLGYAVLGSMLGHLRTWSWTKTLLVSVPLLVGGFAVTYFGYHHMIVVTHNDYATYAKQIELYWTFCSPNVVAMSAAVFLLTKKCVHLPSGLARALADVNRCGFGIYCAHYLFIGAVFHVCVKPLALPVAVQLPLTALLSYFVVWGVVHVLRALPLLRRIA